MYRLSRLIRPPTHSIRSPRSFMHLHGALCFYSVCFVDRFSCIYTTRRPMVPPNHHHRDAFLDLDAPELSNLVAIMYYTRLGMALNHTPIAAPPPPTLHMLSSSSSMNYRARGRDGFFTFFFRRCFRWNHYALPTCGCHLLSFGFFSGLLLGLGL